MNREDQCSWLGHTTPYTRCVLPMNHAGDHDFTMREKHCGDTTIHGRHTHRPFADEERDRPTQYVCPGQRLIAPPRVMRCPRESPHAAHTYGFDDHPIQCPGHPLQMGAGLMGPPIGPQRKCDCVTEKGQCTTDLGCDDCLCGCSGCGCPGESDQVNHPPHYNQHPSGIECIVVVEHMSFNLGNAVKYIWRADLKSDDPLVDLSKAKWYLDREISRLQRRSDADGRSRGDG